MFPLSEAVNAKTDDGEKKGCRYEVANCGIIHKKGGVKKCMVVTKDGCARKSLNLQVANVHKALSPVIELVDSGHLVIFDKDWSFIEDKSSEWRDTIDRRDDELELVTWVKSAPSDAEKSNGKPSGKPCRQGFGRPV